MIFRVRAAAWLLRGAVAHCRTASSSAAPRARQGDQQSLSQAVAGRRDRSRKSIFGHFRR